MSLRAPTASEPQENGLEMAVLPPPPERGEPR